MRWIGRLLLVVLLVCLVSGCDPDLWKYPDDDPQVQWVSEDPNMSFAWDEEEGGLQGKLVAEDSTWQIGVGFRASRMSVICLDSEKEDLFRRELFGGKCKFEEEQITLSVAYDDIDIFGGDLPTIVFEKRVQGEDEGS